MLLWFLVACGSSVPSPTGHASSTPGTASTGGGTGRSGVGATADSGADCGALPGAPLEVERLSGPPASEDFAFDDLGHLLSFQGTFLVRSLYPPGAVTPWVATQGGPGGPASVRALPGGDFVYHDVDTSTLYRVTASGGVEPVFSGLAYAGGIEVHSDTLVYVVDLAGLRRIDPVAGTQDLHFAQAPWSGANGVTLTVDRATLLVSAKDGVWAVPLDASGVPTGPPVAWAAPPPRATELLGMGVDACDNVYVVGSTADGVSTLWRYPVAGGEPEVLLERPGGWLSNLQWGRGVGGWESDVLYVVDRAAQASGYDAVRVGVVEKPR